MTVYENTGQFDLDIRSSGNGWLGTFGMVIAATVADITLGDDYGPVEVTLDGGEVVTGVLSPGFGGDVFNIDHRVIEVEYVRRFRA